MCRIPTLYIHGRVQWWKSLSTRREASSLTNFTLEEFMNIFIMQLNNAQKDFDVFFARVHSTSPPFRNARCRGHWTDHDHFRGSITRFDYGQFHMKTCSYGSWVFSCMITTNYTPASIHAWWTGFPIDIQTTVPRFAPTALLPCELKIASFLQLVIH